MRRLPPLRALEAFVRTVRLGSARAAAEELGLSPSALSRRIGNLEEFTGKKMFSRTGQAMRLTDEGRNFYDAIAPHLEALAIAVESQSENLQLLRLRLGVLPLFGTQRLFPKLPELRAPSQGARCARTPRGRARGAGGASLPLFRKMQLVSSGEIAGLGKATNNYSFRTLTLPPTPRLRPGGGASGE